MCLTIHQFIVGRRNRVKHKDTNHIPSKDNQQQTHVNSNNNFSQVNTNSNSNSGSGGSSGHVDHDNQSHNNKQTPTVQQVCEYCQRLENELKKLKNDVNHMKQVEHDLRQKLESTTSAKSSLQAKQKENEELDKKFVGKLICFL